MKNLDEELSVVMAEIASLENKDVDKSVEFAKSIVDDYVGTPMSEDSLEFLIECAMYVDNHEQSLDDVVVEHINRLTTTAVGKVKVCANAFMYRHYTHIANKYMGDMQTAAVIDGIVTDTLKYYM